MPPKLASLFLFLLAAFLVACGGDSNVDSDVSSSNAAPEVERTVRSAFQAYNQRNLDAFLSFWTDAGLSDEFGATRRELRATGSAFFEGPQLTLRSISNTAIVGNEATTEVDFVFGRQLSRSRYELVHEGGGWKINGTEGLPASVPNGTTRINVDLDEHSFEYSKRILNGKSPSRRKTSAASPHELVLLRVPASFDLGVALRATSENLPAGVELMGFLRPLDPNGEGLIVFTEALPTGRYFMVCSLPDETNPADTPHVAKGMAREFAIPSQGGP